MMEIHAPKLICAAPELEPGTVKIEWQSDGSPRFVKLPGNDADNALEQFRAATDETARALLLVSIIQTRKGA
jgi:hypothetical protein